MKILIAIEDLRIGGAQTFALRLAQAFQLAGHEVMVHCHYHHHINQEMVAQLAPTVTVVAHGSRLPVIDWAMRKMDGLLRRIGIRFSLREHQTIGHLRCTIAEFSPDVVNSHTIKADYVAAKALRDGGPPLVITMHGCYELFLHKSDAPEVTPKGYIALQKAAAVVYLTTKNLEILQQAPMLGVFNAPLVQIYNGFGEQFSSNKADYSRASLGISERAFVFGMVARGIPEKGWEHAITSFLELSEQHAECHLVLVGEGDCLTQLQQQFTHPNIHFIGFSRNPIDWIAWFDVGLLPSYYHAESLPNSIAEYLFCGKPVIATRIGEVPHMLATSAGLAGHLVDVDTLHWRLPQVDQLTTAMRYYMQNPAQLARHKRRASLAFEKFRMKYCVEAYKSLFRQVRGANVMKMRDLIESSLTNDVVLIANVVMGGNEVV